VRGPRERGFSLAARFAATGSLLVAGFAAALLLYLPARLDEEARTWTVSRARGIAHIVADSAAPALDFDDAAAGAAALASLHATDGARYARLLRADGSALATWGEDLATPPGLGEEGAAFEGALVHVRAAFRTRAGREGAVEAGFGLGELEARQAAARRIVLGGALGVFALGVLAAMGLGWLVARPLRRMTGIARRVAEGEEAAARELPRGGGEEGTLAAAFARMLERLWEQRSRIEGMNAELALQVAERSRELARTSDALAALRRTQEQLVVADRRISVGRLAAGVAHEVNNPLSFISGNLSFSAVELDKVRRALASGAPEDVADAHRALAAIDAALQDGVEGVERVAHIVRSLKTFARQDGDARAPLDLREAVAAAIDMAGPELKHRARLVRDLSRAPPVLGNAVRLSQVFLNLLINAAQAVDGRGAGRNEIRISLRRDPEGWAVCEVSDTGCGMGPDVLAHLWEPFFTTKPVGVGSGLGLSVSRNIVEAHGGAISVESREGEGSTFRVRLPPCPVEALAGETAAGEPSPPPPAPARRRVLVVDDEPLVCAAVARMLGEHEVVTETEPRAALARVGRGERFDAVLCDVMMPGLDGEGVVSALRASAPELAARVVLMTGGAFTEGARRFLRDWRGTVLEKPLQLEALRRAVNEHRT
jgi:signal transduction histidine kinase/CheY-like chemotaxis protein